MRDNLSENSVYKTSALGGAVGFCNLYVFIQSHIKRYLGEIEHLRKRGLYNHNIHEGKTFTLPQRSVNSFVYISSVCILVLKHCLYKFISETSIFLILVFVKYGIGRSSLLELTETFQNECADCVKIVIPENRLVFESLKKMLVVEYYAADDIAPQLAVFFRWNSPTCRNGDSMTAVINFS